jgi:CubicO group peptidase (beta-lactamase class C family)
MKKYWYHCLLFSFYAFNSFAQTKVESIEKLMKQFASNQQFNGIVLVAEKGKTIYQKAFGIADYEWKIANTSDTKFEIASITKTFTALMVMQLAEHENLNLDGKISNYLIDYPKEAGDKITINQLLSHSSGLQRDIADFPPNGNNFPDIVAKINEEFLSLKEQVDLIAKRPLLFEPGAKFSYSSDGYTVLGRILEVICKKSYEEVLDSLIIKPLHLINTGYKNHYTIIGKKAVGYAEEYHGLEKARQIGIAPSGGMYSTAADLLKWEQALYSNQIIGEKSKEIIFRKTPAIVSYGWKVNTNYFKGSNSDSLKVVRCTGALPGFNSLVVRFLKDNKTVILLENIRQINYKQDDIVDGIANILYSKPYSLPKKSLAKELLRKMPSSGTAQLMSLYKSLKKNTAEYYLSEQEINSIGYFLLYNLKKTDAAVILFEINTLEFPKSANAFDSIGEAYMVRGDNKNAVESYKKSLELDPTNDNAQKMIEKLTQNK